MCDDPTGFGRIAEGLPSADALSQISRALGVPVAAFYGSGAGDEPQGALAAVEADGLLGLVSAYFQRVSAENRLAFADAVQALAGKE